MTLPNLFVIGAPKCGTTSLHHYLDQHPAISMSRVKEPWVFASPDYHERLGLYAEMLDGRAPVRGESSAVYSMHPHFPEVPERIAGVVPDARILYLVRDPVDRALSHYVQLVSDGKEARSIGEALADFDAEDNVYVAASRYRTQLLRYLDAFDPARIMVVDQAELRVEPGEALAGVFGFLGVADFWSDAFGSRLNTAEEHRTRTAVGRRLPLASLRRLPIPRPVRARIRRMTSRRVPRPTLDPELRASLAEELSEEVAWLRDFTGRRFPGWSV